MTCRLGLRFRISDFKPETGFGVRAPLVDLDHEAQLPLPGAGVGLAVFRGSQEKGGGVGGKGRWPSGNSLSPGGP